MTHRKRVRPMVCVLVAITLMVTLLHGSAFATSAEDGRRIVAFQGINLTTQVGLFDRARAGNSEWEYCGA